MQIAERAATRLDRVMRNSSGQVLVVTSFSATSPFAVLLACLPDCPGAMSRAIACSLRKCDAGELATGNADEVIAAVFWPNTGTTASIAPISIVIRCNLFVYPGCGWAWNAGNSFAACGCCAADVAERLSPGWHLQAARRQFFCQLFNVITGYSYCRWARAGGHRSF